MRMKYLRRLKIELVKGEFQNLVKGQVRGPEQVYDTFKAIKDKAQETLIAVYLTNELETIAYDIHSVGNEVEALFMSEDLYGRGYVLRAKYFILVHNHPSGDPTPSEADRMLFVELQKQTAFMKTKFLDFIIVGDLDDTTTPHYWSSFEESEGGEYTLGAISFDADG